MIELRSHRQLRNAIERARREARYLIVRRTDVPRRYSVTNRFNGNNYIVNFHVNDGGKRYGDCSCMAGQNGLPCKHLAAAAALNIYLAQQGLLDRHIVRAA